MNTGGIYERNLAHTDDTNLWTVAEGCHHFLKLITCTEEERTIDLIYLHALRDGVVVEVGGKEVKLLVQVNLVIGDRLDIGSLCHSLHEEQASTYQTYLDGNRQVEDDGEEEGNQEDGDITLRVLHQCEE